jgi:hypothetical protein
MHGQQYRPPKQQPATKNIPPISGTGSERLGAALRQFAEKLRLPFPIRLSVQMKEIVLPAHRLI